MEVQGRGAGLLDTEHQTGLQERQVPVLALLLSGWRELAGDVAR